MISPKFFYEKKILGPNEEEAFACQKLILRHSCGLQSNPSESLQEFWRVAMKFVKKCCSKKITV